MNINLANLITKEQIIAIYRRSALLKRDVIALTNRVNEAYPFLVKAMEEFEINTPIRIAAFLAQIGHESGALKFKVEIWGPTPAQQRYENNRRLGNTQPKDGFKFRGRGYIQTTGRHNYAVLARALNIDCVNNPDLLATTENAARSAAFFWGNNKLNLVADTIIKKPLNFRLLTKKINGGLNGYDDRLAYFKKALAVMDIKLDAEIT
jgi:putative chitinase